MAKLRVSAPSYSLCLLLTLAAGCRDEQAGPRNRGTASSGSGGVQSLEAAPSDLSFRSGASWGLGGPQYLGAKVGPADARPGQQVTVSHYFIARTPPPRGWGFFVHAVDAESGQMVANLDHPLQDGRAPLEAWPVGRVIEDRHSFTVPQSPSGKVHLVLGFWKGDQRLPVADPAAADGEQRMRGPVIGGGGAAALPEYHVARASRPPTIDGVIDPAEWAAATPVQLVGSSDGRAPQVRTLARLLWDDAHLYVAFDAEDGDVWGTLREHDAKIYEEEVVEIFLDANADGRTYNELQVSPHNVQFDAYFPARRQGMDLTWKSGMQSAVKVDGTLDDDSDRDRGWTVELKIPFAQLSEVPRVPPAPGDRWRFNLYRLEHHKRRRNIEGQAFSPLFVGDFHALPRFGWLVFQAAPSASPGP